MADTHLQAAADSLLYLRSFVSDSAAALGRFIYARILLVAGAYPLISAIKTLARLGARRLSVLQVDHEWRDEELRKAFMQLACWPDAALDIVTTPEPGHTYVLHCAADPAHRFEAVIDALPAAQHLVALVADGQLCALRGDDLALLLPRPRATTLSAPDGLCAGATAAMLCFDDLCGVRPLAARRYWHFGLDADVPMGSAGLYPLLPFAEGWAGADDAIVVGARVAELVRTPLSPLRAPVERTADGSYVKLYTFEVWLPGQDAPQVLVAAGMTRAQCMAGALRQLAGDLRHWFCDTAPAERAALGAYLTQLDAARQAIALQAEWPLPGPVPHLSAKEQYLSFCINTCHGLRPQWSDVALRSEAWPCCTVLSAGGATVYLPHTGELGTGQREAGLLALYGALWSRDGIAGAPAGCPIVLPEEPLQPPEVA